MRLRPNNKKKKRGKNLVKHQTDKNGTFHIMTNPQHIYTHISNERRKKRKIKKEED